METRPVLHRRRIPEIVEVLERGQFGTIIPNVAPTTVGHGTTEIVTLVHSIPETVRELRRSSSRRTSDGSTLQKVGSLDARETQDGRCEIDPVDELSRTRAPGS